MILLLNILTKRDHGFDRDIKLKEIISLDGFDNDPFWD